MHARRQSLKNSDVGKSSRRPRDLERNEGEEYICDRNPDGSPPDPPDFAGRPFRPDPPCDGKDEEHNRCGKIGGDVVGNLPCVLVEWTRHDGQHLGDDVDAAEFTPVLGHPGQDADGEQPWKNDEEEQEGGVDNRRHNSGEENHPDRTRHSRMHYCHGFTFFRLNSAVGSAP